MLVIQEIKELTKQKVNILHFWMQTMLHPNKIKFQLNFMKKNKFDITHTSYYIVNSNRKIISKREAINLTYDD